MDLVSSYCHTVKVAGDEESLVKFIDRCRGILAVLAHVLYTCYEKPCIILIDDFDLPFAQAHKFTSLKKNRAQANIEYERIRDLLIGMLTTALEVCLL